MFKINLDDRTLEQLEECAFSELKLRERDDLQEWIAKQPEVLGEELLVIQKEFSGFSKTRERLDLLALDKDGTLVVIENKLDDSGRDVAWQALKYASHCSGFTNDDIKKIYQEYLDKNEPGTNAEESLADFFEDNYAEIDLNPGVTQRIILIAAKFRPEITSTALWLLDNNINIQCFTVTPYAMKGDVILSINKIIPTKDEEEFRIKMAEKVQGTKIVETTRGRNRVEFWGKLLDAMEQKSEEHAQMFQVKSGRNILGTSAGMSGVRYRMIASPKIARVILRIEKRNPHREYIYNELKKHKEEIHAEIGFELDWQDLTNVSVVRITVRANVSDKSQWDEMIKFHINHFIPMEKALRKPLQKIFSQLNQS